jgi:hypothetical protein
MTRGQQNIKQTKCTESFHCSRTPDLNTVIPRLMKIIRSEITFVS